MSFKQKRKPTSQQDVPAQLQCEHYEILMVKIGVLKDMQDHIGSSKTRSSIVSRIK